MLSINQVWRNEKSREILIQVVVLILLGWFLMWLADNVSQNFKTLCKDLSFEFLTITACYDINQYYSYNNRDTIWAAIVGLLNTGLVAICGIIIATFFLILDVLRLSKTGWQKIAYWYTEFTRNVPILLHILLWHGIIINTLPHPRKQLEFMMYLLSNRGFYFKTYC